MGSSATPDNLRGVQLCSAANGPSKRIFYEGSYFASEIRLTPSDEELNEALAELKSYGMLYHLGAHAPDWWDLLKILRDEGRLDVEP
jgi:hypothetical protein